MPRKHPLRPVIELAMVVPDVILRASSDQNGVVFAACVHTAANANLSLVGHDWSGIRRAGHDAIQFGAAVYMLAPGEAGRFLHWLRHGAAEPSGEC